MSALKLDYAFLSDPNPILASVGGANPNRVDLLVLIENKHAYAVAMKQIIIEIPTGSSNPRVLSATPQLPNATYDTTGLWEISTGAGVITITSQDRAATNVGVIVFSLKGIAVNETRGIVPVAVHEMDGSSTRVTDDDTYTLVKRPADFPVTNFRVDPTVLQDLDGQVTLRWNCTDQGRNLVYSLRARGVEWMPKDCTGTGDCFTCNDGGRGVTTPPLQPAPNATSLDFLLDVIQTEPTGARTVHATLSTTVRVELPILSTGSYITKAFMDGLVVDLHWIAFHAARCIVSLDGDAIDDHAPVNTYDSGYRVAMTSKPPGTHQFVVEALSPSGDTSDTHLFAPVNVRGSVSTFTVGEAAGCALSPDGSRAYVPLVTSPMLVLDTRNGNVVATIPTVAPVLAFAVSADGRRAVVSSQPDGISVIDVASNNVVANFNIKRALGRGLAVSPDGQYAVTTTADGHVLFVDLTTGKVVVDHVLIEPADRVAISSNGASVAAIGSNTSVLYPIDGRTHAVLDIGGVSPHPTSVAFTTDCRYFVVASPDSNLIEFRYIDTLDFNQPYRYVAADSPSAVMTLVDGKTALAVSQNANKLYIIDIPSLSVYATLPVVERPMFISASRDPSVVALMGGQGKLNILRDRQP